MKRLLPFILLFTLTACGGGTDQAQESFIAGNGAVTFIKNSDRALAPTLSGKTLNGSQLVAAQGVSVINVWASWCAPCRAEAATLQALSIKYPDVPFYGILTRDTEANGRSFVATYGITYPTFIDDALLLGFNSTLPANAIPSTLVLDKAGKIAGRISGEVTVSSLSNLIERVKSE